MKTKLALALVAAALAGCATITKDSAPAVYYTDKAGKSHIMTGELIKKTTDSGVYASWQHGLQVAVDGIVIIQGYLDPNNFQGTAAGKYKDLPAVANCTSRPGNPGYFFVNCDVAIDGEKVGTLKF